MGNAKAIDIVAEKSGKIFPIQVKTIFKKKNIGWPIMKAKVKTKHYYIFVNLNGDKLLQPDYFVLTADEAITYIKDYEHRGILSLSLVNNKNFIGRWDKLN